MHSFVCWHVFFCMLTWKGLLTFRLKFWVMLTWIPLYVDVCCRIKNSCQHTGECMSTCSFWIRKRGCMLTYEQKHATWNTFDDHTCGVRCGEKFYSTWLNWLLLICTGSKVDVLNTTCMFTTEWHVWRCWCTTWTNYLPSYSGTHDLQGVEYLQMRGV